MANPKIEVEIGAKTKEFNDKLRDVRNDLDKTGKSFGKLNEFAVGALQGIAAAFTVGAVVNFGKAVLDTTAKFQKFEAVLTNTLGSNSAAKIALNEISEFASKTPFQVDELTSSFVKLANQGFRPTVDQLRSLGDLAASTGKSFDQLAEAIIDAQVGEFERLKEFGIRASKEGDNVTFTFKGVETQVKATDSAIRDYILSLGQAEGVSGAMAAVSATVGGKISNLEDNIESLRKAIGDRSSGVFAASLDWLNSFVETATMAVKSVSDIKEQVRLAGGASSFNETNKEVDFLVEKLSKTLPIQEAINRAVDLTAESYRNLSDDISKGFISSGKLQKQLSELEEYRTKLLADLAKKTKDVSLSQEDYNKAIQQAIKNAYDYETAQLNALKLQRQLDPNARFASATSGLTGTEGDSAFNNAVAQVQAQIAESLANFNATETTTLFKGELESLLEKVDELSGAFSGLGSLIGKAFNNAPLGQFVGEFLRFSAKLIAANFKIASANAITGATQSATATGPAAAITLPAFIAGAVGLVASAFAAIGGGGGRSVGSSGVGGGVAQTFGGSGSTGLSFDRSLALTGEFRVKGQDLVYVFNEASSRNAKG